MRRALVTGAGSFIGAAFRARVAAFPGAYEADALSLRGNGWRDMDFSGYDSIIHAAGLAHVRYRESMGERYMAVNRDLAVETAQKAKADGCGHFIFLSSMIVYGPAARAGKTRRIGPDTPAAPENAYGKSKLLAEEGIRALADETFRVAILRLPTVYGKGCKGSYATLSRWAGKLPVFPDISGARSVLYAENLAELLRLIIDDRAEGTFFPQNAECASAAELMGAIARARGEKIRFTRLFNPALRLLGGHPFLRKAFGGMAYEPGMSAYPRNYRIVDFFESIRRTEE
jgi:nucleoside-diphosphate-sugar epimerase